MIITVADNPFIQMEIVNRNDDQKCCPSKLDIVTISELSSYTQWCRNHLEWFGKVSNFKSFKYQVNFRLRELKELIKYVFVFIHVFLRIHAFVFNIIDRPGIYPLRWLSWCKRRQTQRHSETMKSFPISSMTLSDQSKSVGVKFISLTLGSLQCRQKL